MHYRHKNLNVKDYFTLLSKLVRIAIDCLAMRAMRAMMRVMVLRQIALTKWRAGPTFSCDEGNEGNQFSTLWKIYRILVLDRVKESFHRAAAIEKRLPSLPSLPSY